MSGVAGYSESTPSESEALNRSQPNDGIFEEDSPEERPVRERISALDAFRGLTIAGMLLVNNPGTWSAIYPPLQHAPWHGWTPTDLIFPFFLFIVGVTTHLSLAAMVQQGADADFGRGVSAYERWIGDAEAPHPNLGTIEQPPFYALPIDAHSAGTKGGPRTNTRGQVLDVRGNVIAGLYAAGNVMAGVSGPGYFGGGGTIGLAMTWGYLSGINAANDAKANAG